MSASKDEIRNSYLDLTKKHHPDVNGNSPTSHEKFKRISQAYSVLSSPTKRRTYDEELLAGMDLRTRQKAYSTRPFTHTNMGYYERQMNYEQMRHRYYQRYTGYQESENDTFNGQSSLYWMMTRIGSICLILVLFTLPARWRQKKINMERRQIYLDHRRELLKLYELDEKKKPEAKLDVLKTASSVK